MEYIVKIYLNEKNGDIYAYSTMVYANDVMEAGKIIERHISNFKKSTKFNVGIYVENKLVAGYTSAGKDWFFNNDDEWVLLIGGITAF